MSPTIEEELRAWAEACPLIGYPVYLFAEVTVILHQGMVAGVDVRQKHRYTAQAPPSGGSDSNRNKSEPSGTS